MKKVAYRKSKGGTCAPAKLAAVSNKWRTPPPNRREDERHTRLRASLGLDPACSDYQSMRRSEAAEELRKELANIVGDQLRDEEIRQISREVANKGISPEIKIEKNPAEFADSVTIYWKNGTCHDVKWEGYSLLGDVTFGKDNKSPNFNVAKPAAALMQSNRDAAIPIRDILIFYFPDNQSGRSDYQSENAEKLRKELANIVGDQLRDEEVRHISQEIAKKGVSPEIKIERSPSDFAFAINLSSTMGQAGETVRKGCILAGDVSCGRDKKPPNFDVVRPAAVLVQSYFSDHRSPWRHTKDVLVVYLPDRDNIRSDFGKIF